MLEPGTILLEKYRIERLLGEGGMGVVAKAHHVQLDQSVAIKFLQPTMLENQQVVRRFLREAQAAVKLKSEHVCSVFDVGTMENGSPYMVMEFMDGMDVSQLVLQQGALAPGFAVDLLLQACAAMAEAHSLGIVHRDIKPANFFLTTRPDSTLLLKVLDFGISKAPVAQEATELTQAQAVLGTPAYMSPEQMRSSKQVDARTDIWALGVVLYELLAGHRPFRGMAFSEICLKVAVDPTPPLDAPLPPGLEQVVARCLEKDLTQRYQTVAELAIDLAPYAQTSHVAASIVGSVSRMVGGAVGTSRWRALTADRIAQMGATSPPISTLGGSAGQVAEQGSPKRRTGVMASVAAAVVVAAALALLFLGGGDPSGQSDSDEIRSASAAPNAVAPERALPDAGPPEAGPPDAALENVELNPATAPDPAVEDNQPVATESQEKSRRTTRKKSRRTTRKRSRRTTRKTRKRSSRRSSKTRSDTKKRESKKKPTSKPDSDDLFGTRQ